MYRVRRYGDNVPVTPAGKVLAALTMTMGYTFVVLGLRQFYDSWSATAASVRNQTRMGTRSTPSRAFPPRDADSATLVESKSGPDHQEPEISASEKCFEQYEWRLRGLAALAMLHACATKVFFGGVGWQAVSLVVDADSNSTAYVLLVSALSVIHGLNV